MGKLKGLRAWARRYASPMQLVQSEKNTAVTLIAIYKALGGGWGS